VFYLPTGKAFSVTGTVREPRDLGFDLSCHSRGLLEYCVRQCTLQHANIRFVGQSNVRGLACRDGRVHGVHYTQFGETHTLATDLVVDAGGRKSQAPRWLTELGFRAPEETTIGVDLGYASTKFHMPADYDESERATELRGLEALARTFFPKAAEIIDTPWALAASQDLAYPQTRGDRPADLEERAQYFADVDALSADDAEVHRLVTEVFNLVKPLAALEEASLRRRVEACKGPRPNPPHHRTS
jgi:hypothetical protein